MPSIMSEGATTSAPARASDTACRARFASVASLSTLPSLAQHAAVAVVGVLAEADVGDAAACSGSCCAQGAERALHDAVVAPRRAADGVLVLRDAEQDDRRRLPRRRRRGGARRCGRPTAARRRASSRSAARRPRPGRRTAAARGRSPRAASRAPCGAARACGGCGAGGRRGSPCGEELYHSAPAQPGPRMAAPQRPAQEGSC